MKNKNGFTLVELLVVITIMGIITVLALPGVQQLQARNRDKKFEAYSNRLENAGKLYVDSNSSDMFGISGNGCYDISYQNLYTKSLIKNYATEGINCDSDKTFVHVERNNGKYTYDVSLYCKKDDKVIYEHLVEKCSEASMTDLPTIHFDYINDGGNDDWSKSKHLTIKLTARDGFNNNTSIRYGWTTDNGTIPSNLEEHNFKNAFGETELTLELDISNLDDEYYFFIDGDNVIDTRGHFSADFWSPAKLKFDKTAPASPILNNAYNGLWADPSYVKANSYIIEVTSSDNKSGIKYYQYRYPNSENVWHTYASSTGSSFTTPPFTQERNEIVEIRACDYADNCSAPTQSMIKIDTTAPTCSISLLGTGGTNATYTSVVTVTLNANNTGQPSKSNVSYGLVDSNTETYNNKTSESQGASNGITWYGFIKDEAGNKGTCDSGNFKVSLKPPVITFSIDGLVSTATCKDGNTDELIKTFNKTMSLTDLTHTVSCTNASGQTTTDSHTYQKYCITSKKVCQTCCGNCGCYGYKCCVDTYPNGVCKTADWCEHCDTCCWTCNCSDVCQEYGLEY